MKSDNHWEKEVDNSMELLGQIGRVQPSEEFEFAVMARLREEGRQGFSWSITAIAAGLVLLIGLNLFSLFAKNNNRTMDKSSPVTSFYKLQEGGDIYDQILKR